MIKFFVKQFLYGRIFLWFQSNLNSIFFLIVLISLTFYSHNEYLNYLQFKQKTEGDYIGLSFVIKNLLIPFDSECIQAWRVTRQVNVTSFDNPNCLEKLDKS